MYLGHNHVILVLTVLSVYLYTDDWCLYWPRPLSNYLPSTVPRVNYVASPVNVWPDRWYRLQLDAGQGVLYDASDLLACVKLWYGHHMEGHLEQTIWYRDWFSSLQNFRNSSLRVLEFWFRSNFKLNFFLYIKCPTVWYHILKWHCLWRNIHIISMFIVFLHMKWMACLKGTIWYWVRGV